MDKLIASIDRSAILQLAFRPFFLLGAIFSCLSLGLWSAWMAGQLKLAVYGNPVWWHLHEMLFGFVAAIIVGFLLTAVQNWTGERGVSGRALAGLTLLWLLGRVVLLFPTLLSPPWIALIDIAFLPVAALTLALPIIRVRQWRNILFVPILLAMSLANVALHWAAQSHSMDLQVRAGNAMVMLVTLLIVIMGGRVIPMFTANGTGTVKVLPVAALEKASLCVMALALLACFEPAGVPRELLALCFMLASMVQTVRVARWRSWVTVKTPLVWSLHLSYWCIPLGLSLYALSFVTTAVSQSQAIHALTVGGIGLMILAMISRVSLGHTGRPLMVGKALTLAFGLMFGAFAVRVFGVYWLESYTQMIVTAAVLWLVAYGVFIVLYLPILGRPRLDGKPG